MRLTLVSEEPLALEQWPASGIIQYSIKHTPFTIVKESCNTIMVRITRIYPMLVKIGEV